MRRTGGATGTAPIRVRYPLLDTNGVVVWPVNFWAVNWGASGQVTNGQTNVNWGSFAGTVNGNLGDGTNLNASELRSGTVPGARLPLADKSGAVKFPPNTFMQTVVVPHTADTILHTPPMGLDIWYSAEV